MKRAILLLTAMAVVITTQQAAAQYYYGNGQRIPLQIDPSRILVKFDSTAVDAAEQLMALYPQSLEAVYDDSTLLHGFVACSVLAGTDNTLLMTNVKERDFVKRVEPFYLTGDTVPFVIGLSFTVKFMESVSRREIDSLNSHFGVEISGRSDARPGVYYLRATDDTEDDLLTLANSYYELKQTLFSSPVFCVPAIRDGYAIYDYYHEYQWHIKKITGNFNNGMVWDFAGLRDTAPDDTIVVAVLDDGMVAHPDLPATRIRTGYDFADDDYDVEPTDYNFHGMACAGIIAASHSTDPADSSDPAGGMISMAPRVDINPGKVFTDTSCVGPLPDTVFAEAIDWAWNWGEADVISCSWHYWEWSDNIADAIHVADSCGRHGKGTTVVFSSGNQRANPDSVNFPARHPDCLAVGAIDEDDERFLWSCYDSTLDLVAPSGEIPAKQGYPLIGDVWSLDQPGYGLGYNPEDYAACPDSANNDDDFVCQFGGTSAAAPLVAGTAALILEFDSLLTSSEVKAIIKSSAVTALASGTITPPDTAYGYGRVDAFRAILSLARGDMNADGKHNLSDITWLQSYIYSSGPDPFPDYRLGNCDCDSLGAINLSDITLLIDHIYQSKDPLPTPCFVY